MKKLMIAAAAIMVGVVANAASVVWTATNIYKPGSTSDKIASGNGLVYYFCSQVTDDSEISTALGSTETSLADKTTWLGNNSIANSALNADGKIAQISTAWDHTAGTYNFYAVIFADNSVKEGGKYVITAESDALGWDNSSNTAVALGTQKSLTQNLNNWDTVATQSVPEPTSGLLLVLGMAGLALRRRRA